MFSRLLFSINGIYLFSLLINLTSNSIILNNGNVIKKLIFIMKKDEVMVKEKIVMLMSKIGLQPVLSHNLLAGYTPRGILFTSQLGFLFMLTISDLKKSEETVWKNLLD